MKNIALTIDGKKISCSSGTSLLETAEAHGIYIPTLCYHPALKPHGGCRLCLVEEKNSGKLYASCVTPAADGMVIVTNSERILEHRRNIIRLMISEHPESCVVCSKGNRCRLRKIAGELGIGEPDLYPMPNYAPQEQSNPFISRDLSKCIMCGRCIRACGELVATGAVHYSMRGFKSRPATAHYLPLKDSECTFCGTCVSMCPTGALTQTGSPYSGTPEREHQSTCGFCGIGCSLDLGISGNRVVEVNPSQKKESVNGDTLCVRGCFAHDFLNSSKRLTQPAMRQNNELTPLSWEKAIKTVSERFLAVKERYGADSIGFMGSSKCTNEENYLFQKIAKALIGTNNIDNGGSRYGRNNMALLDRLTGGSCRINRLTELEKSEAILVIGADPCQTLPVMGYHIKRAANKNIPLILMDCRQTELANYASVWLKPDPQNPDTAHYTNVINALSAVLLHKQKNDLQLIEWYTENFNHFCRELQSLDLEKVIRKTGVDQEQIEKAAELLADKKTALVIGGEIFEQKDGTPAIHAIFNLSLMSGGFCCQRGSIHISGRENNLTGAWDMGTVPDSLPGRLNLNDNTGSTDFAKAWQRELSPHRGLDMIGMIEAAEKGTLKALYIMGENPVKSLPQQEKVKRALEKLDLLVVQDILANETTEIAHIVLPGAAFSEKKGSFTNVEGRIQLFTPAVSPPEHAKSDFEILALIASTMKNSASETNIDTIREEIGRLIPAYAGLTAGEEMAWVGNPGSANKMQTVENKPHVSFSKLITPEETVHDNGFPFTAVITSSRCHAGSGTRTGNSNRIKNSGLKGEIELAESDLTRLGLKNGNKVRIVSQFGTITRKTRVNKGLSPGVAIIPTAFNENDVVNLFPLSSPESKEFQGWRRCSIKIERAAD